MRKYLDILNGSVEAETPKTKTNMLSRYVGLIEEGYGASTISGLKVEEFVRGYIEAMLATAVGQEGEALKKGYTADDIDAAAMDQIEADCRSFLHKSGAFISPDHYNGAELSSLEAKAGHDFYMARNGHGGFEDWESSPMMSNAMSMGHVSPYTCNGKICMM